MDRALAVFGILVGLAGAAISLIGLSDDSLKQYPWIAENRPTILVVSLAISALSFLVLLWSWLAQVKNVLRSIWEMAEGRAPRKLANMKLTEISEGQLELAYDYIATTMQHEGVSQVLTFEQFRSMWRRVPSVYAMLWDQSDPVSLRIVGFISVFPLNRTAAEEVLSCHLRGSQLRAEHLAGAGERPAAYFIGAIAASSWKAKAEVVRVLDNAIARLKLHKEIPLLLTSPFTQRGRSLARKFGFRHLGDYPGYGELWSQSYPAQVPTPFPAWLRRK